MARIITVTSGTDGHGKSSICMNLAAQLARRGRRVCLLDADGGHANVSVALGLRPNLTLEDLVRSGTALSDVLLHHCDGFDIVPASSNSEWMGAMTSEQRRRLAACLIELERYDIVLIDSSSSRARNALSLALTSPEIVLVISTEIASHTGAYALLRLLRTEQPARHIRVVVNRSRNQTLGNLSYSHFQELAQFYLGVGLPLLGLVSEDEYMRNALHEQRTLVGRYPQAPASNDFGILADRLLVDHAEREEQGFGGRFLIASETESSGEFSAAEPVQVTAAGQHKLPERLQSLSDEDYGLIQEMARPPHDRRASAPLSAHPGSPPYRRADSCSERWLAAVAQDEQSVTVQGQTFSIYAIDRACGSRQQVAWHSSDDNLEASESG